MVFAYSMFRKLASKPQQLFLIDGLGAFSSALFIAILAKWDDHLGIPATVLFLLCSLACVCGIYSLCCHFLIANNWWPFLKTIAIANVLYCCLTLGLVLNFSSHLSTLGLTYFSAEILVMSGLVTIELKALCMRIDR